MQENARLGRKVNFAPGKIPSGGKIPENAYIVYQPGKRPNIVQGHVMRRSMVNIQSATAEIRRGKKKKE